MVYTPSGGTAFLTASMRAALTAVYDGLEELPGVHDVDFHFSDGTRAGFEATLDRWARNGRILLGARFPLWQVWRLKERARAWVKIRVAYRALQAFSWPVYVDASR